MNPDYSVSLPEHLVNALRGEAMLVGEFLQTHIRPPIAPPEDFPVPVAESRKGPLDALPELQGFQGVIAHPLLGPSVRGEGPIPAAPSRYLNSLLAFAIVAAHCPP